MAWDFTGIFKNLLTKSVVKDRVDSMSEKTEQIKQLFTKAIETSGSTDKPAIYGFVDQQKQFQIGMYGGINDYLGMMADLMMHGSTLLAQGDEDKKLAILAQLNKITVIAIKELASENAMMKNPIGGGNSGLPN